MKTKSGKSGGFYLSCIAAILLAAALVRYLSFHGITENGVQMTFVCPLIISVALVILSIFADNSLFVIASPILAVSALCVFLIASINILTGYIFNLAMFGDVTMIGPVSQVAGLVGAATVLMILASFMKRSKADQ